MATPLSINQTFAISDIYELLRDEFDSDSLSYANSKLILETLREYITSNHLYLDDVSEEYKKEKVRIYQEFNSFERRIFQGYFVQGEFIYNFRQNVLVKISFEKYDILLSFYLRTFESRLTQLDKFLTIIHRKFKDQNRDFPLFLRNVIRQDKSYSLIPTDIIDTLNDWLNQLEKNTLQNINQTNDKVKASEQKSFILKKLAVGKSEDNIDYIIHIQNFKNLLEHHNFIAMTGEGSGRIFTSAFNGTYELKEPYFKWTSDIKNLHGLIILLKDEYKLLTNMGKYHWAITANIFKSISGKTFSSDQLRKNNKPSKEKLDILRGIIESTLLKID